MSSSDESVEQEEPDISLEDSPSVSLHSGSSPAHSAELVGEFNDFESTPQTTPSLNIETTPPLTTPSLNIDSTPPLTTPSLNIDSTPPLTTPSLNIDSTPPLITPSLNIDSTPPLITPSLNIETTPSMNFTSETSPPISLHNSPFDTVGTEVPEDDPEHTEVPDSPSQTQPGLLDMLAQAVTEAGEQLQETVTKNPVPFPLTRVKTIMKTDPDTSLLQSDAVFVVGEAAKLFLRRFSKDAHRITTVGKRKILNRADVDTCLLRYQEYFFLEEQLDW